MKKVYLLTPGPTPLPPQVLKALSRPIIHHRTPEFRSVLGEVEENLKYIFQTKNDVFIFASSGTGAMEAAVANLLSAQDKAITVEGGKFGKRWTEICKSYGVSSSVISVEAGRAVEPKAIEERLLADREIKAVFTTLCETSTGVTYDIKGIGEIVKKFDAVLVVDAISGLAAIDCPMDDWNIDCVVAGSQKGLMLPPGLGFISVSSKAKRLIDECRSSKYYFDLKKSQDALLKTDTPFTSAINLIMGLNEALKLLKSEGIKNVFLRHRELADFTRTSIKSLSLDLFAPEAASDCVTAVKVPSHIDGDKLVKTMRDQYGITIAGGQGKLKGKIIRIAHMGYIKKSDIKLCILTLKKLLKKLS